MIATYQPAAYSGTGWANPGNVLGAADGSVAINGSGNGLLILTRTGFVIPTGYEPVGFVIRFTGGTSLATTSTTFGVGYQLEVAAANTATAYQVAIQQRNGPLQQRQQAAWRHRGQRAQPARA